MGKVLRRVKVHCTRILVGVAQSIFHCWKKKAAILG